MMPHAPKEEDLHAYIDGRLGAVEAAQVEAHLSVNPGDAARVEAFRSQRALLRAMYQQAAYEPEPPALGELRDRLAARLAAQDTLRRSRAGRPYGYVLGAIILLVALLLLLAAGDSMSLEGMMLGFGSTLPRHVTVDLRTLTRI